jgi:hypothetical protein
VVDLKLSETTLSVAVTGIENIAALDIVYRGF